MDFYQLKRLMRIAKLKIREINIFILKTITK